MIVRYVLCDVSWLCRHSLDATRAMGVWKREIVEVNYAQLQSSQVTLQAHGYEDADGCLPMHAVICAPEKIRALVYYSVIKLDDKTDEGSDHLDIITAIRWAKKKTMTNEGDGAQSEGRKKTQTPIMSLLMTLDFLANVLAQVLIS